MASSFAHSGVAYSLLPTGRKLPCGRDGRFFASFFEYSKPWMQMAGPSSGYQEARWLWNFASLFEEVSVG